MRHHALVLLPAFVVAGMSLAGDHLRQHPTGANTRRAIISGPTTLAEGQMGTWTATACAAPYRMNWYVNGYAYSASSTTFSHWAMNDFTVESRCSLGWTGWSNGIQEVDVQPATVCEGFNTSAPNYCKTIIGSNSPDGAAPEQVCTYAFYTNLPSDSWVTWKLGRDGDPLHSGTLSEIGNTFNYAHPINESFEIAVTVEAHVATHDEKTIEVGPSLTCWMQGAIPSRSSLNHGVNTFERSAIR